jgi:hypothetical protein
VISLAHGVEIRWKSLVFSGLWPVGGLFSYRTLYAVRPKSLILENKKEHKMKRLQLTIGLLMTFAFSRLQAQTIDLKATIPFEFRMGKTLMAAGDYTIHHSNGVLTLRPENGGNAVVGLAIATDLPKHSSTAGLLFHRYGETYFLYKVWTPGSANARSVPETSLEKELARRGGPDEDLNIVLQTK